MHLQLNSLPPANLSATPPLTLANPKPSTPQASPASLQQLTTSSPPATSPNLSKRLLQDQCQKQANLTPATPLTAPPLNIAPSAPTSSQIHPPAPKSPVSSPLKVGHASSKNARDSEHIIANRVGIALLATKVFFLPCLIPAGILFGFGPNQYGGIPAQTMLAALFFAIAAAYLTFRAIDKDSSKRGICVTPPPFGGKATRGRGTVARQ